MTTPTKKQLVVQSLKALHKERLSIKFRLKALESKRHTIEREESDNERRLQAVESKLLWEVNTHSKTLSDNS